MKRPCLVKLVCMTWLAAVVLGAVCAQAAEDLIVQAYRDGRRDVDQQGRWAVMLRFSSPVFPSNLAQNTTVTMRGTGKSFQLLEHDSRQKATKATTSLILMSTEPSDTAGSITVFIAKGLTDATGRRLLAKDFAYTFLTYEKVSATNFSTFFTSKNEKGVRLSLSSQVSESDLSDAIKVHPGVDNVSITRNQYRDYTITGDFVFDRDYVLKILPEKVAGGTARLEPKEFPFKGPGVKAEIVVNSSGSVVELKSRQLLPLRLANVTKVRCEMVRVPALLAAKVSDALEPPEGEKKPALRTRKRSRGPGAASRKPSSQETSRQVDVEQLVAECKRVAASSKVSPSFIGQVSEDAEAFFAKDAKGGVSGYSLPLSFRKDPDRGGSWLMTLSDPDTPSAEPTVALIQITDLSVSYKVSSETLLVWVTSIYEGQPVAGAEIMLVGADGRKHFAGKTDKNGLLKVRNRAKLPSVEAGTHASAGDTAVDLAQLSSVYAATPSDSCGVRLRSVRLKPSSVPQTAKVADKPETSPNGHVFTERGVYKPGEKAHFKFVSRVYQDKRIVPPAGEKVKVEIVGPRNDVNYAEELTLGEFGSCWDSLQTEAFFPVGTYTITVKAPRSDGAEQTFTNTFEVQEFKKVRHYARISVKREQIESKAYIGLKRTEDYLAVQIQGLYYTGGPVKHGRVRWKAELTSVTNTVKGMEGFFFGNEDDKTQFLESGESVLDGDGKLHLAIPLDSRLLTGIHGVEISATVLDVDGEPATEVHTFNPRPRYLVGIMSHPRQVQVGYSAPFKAVVVDADGKRVPSGTVSASILQQEQMVLEKRDEEGNINESYEDAWRKVISTQQALRNGEAAFPLDFSEGGSYLVSVTFEDKGLKYTSQTMVNVGWSSYGRRRYYGEDEERPAKNEILLAMSKKEYAVGDTVRIEFSTRRPVRKCLVTLERGEVLDAKVIDVNGTLGTYEFTVKDEHLPNVYVSVLAAVGREGFPVYVTQADADIPMVYFGSADVSVRSEVQKLRLEIEPDKPDLKAHPADQTQLSFRVTDHKGAGLVTEMAVCVVDEAVLALTGYKTPELSSLVKFNVPLSVFSGDLRMSLISQDLFRMFGTKPLTGGGMGLGEVHPSLRKDFRPVAYFNPALLTDATGRATIDFKLPDSTTAYRIFAVVCDKGSGFVSGQRKMVVTKEFFMEPSPPRFFCPGDKSVFPVVLHNKTASKGVAKVKAKGSDAMRLDILDPSCPMEPYSGAIIKARATIPGGTDRAVFLFHGKLEGAEGTFDDAVEMAMPIHSRFLAARRVKIGDFSQKTEIQVPLPDELKTVNLPEVNESDFRGHLILSMTNWSKIAPGLKYLLAYPYGCIEQTSSGVIPLAALRSLVQSGDVPGITVDEVDKFLKRGVNRLLSMQLESGGFGYWPNRLNASWWGTMYATTALTLARQAGLDVPEDRMDKAISYVREGLFKREGPDIDQDYAWTKEFALFNLAANKALTAQELEPFLREYDSLGDQSKALVLLAAHRTKAVSHARISEMAAKIRPKVDPSRVDYRHSSFRELAICLLALTETKASPQTADTLAGELMRNLKPDGFWYSTADTGWCLFALGRYFQGKKGEKPATALVKMRYGGNEPVEIPLSGASAQVEIDVRKLAQTGKISLECDTKHLINYTLNVAYPDLVNDPARLNKGFTLRKRIDNLNGKDEIRVGDVVRVSLDLGLHDPTKTNYYSEGFRYLALEDPVPAGLVPINAALKTEGVAQEKTDTNGDSDYRGGRSPNDFDPEFSEFRDDGIRIFKNSAGSGRYQYSYLARAVSEGEFWMRGSRISLMYDPDVFGRTAGQVVKILPVGK